MSSPNRRLRDAAVALPAAGLLLFMPPYVLVFDQPATLFGVPLLLVYIFAAWMIGLILTAVVARRLVRQIDDSADTPGAEPGPDGRAR